MQDMVKKCFNFPTVILPWFFNLHRLSQITHIIMQLKIFTVGHKISTSQELRIWRKSIKMLSYITMNLMVIWVEFPNNILRLYVMERGMGILLHKDMVLKRMDMPVLLAMVVSKDSEDYINFKIWNNEIKILILNYKNWLFPENSQKNCN